METCRAGVPSGAPQATHRRPRLATAATATALVVLLAAAFWAAYTSGGQDFRGYYAAAVVLARGQSPYDYNLVSGVLIQLDGLTRNNPYYYPPWLAALMPPLTLLPFHLARLVWLSLSLAALALTFWLSQRVLSWPSANWQKPLACLAILYPAAWIALRTEQVTILLTACLVGAVWAVQTGRYRLAGVLLALLVTKPTATFLPAFILALCAVRRRRWNLLAASGVTLAALLALPTIIAPGWWGGLMLPDQGQGLWQNLTTPGVAGEPRVNATVTDWSLALGLPWPVAPVVVAAALAFTALLSVRLWRHRISLIDAIVWAGVLNFILTPYALEYDYILMALAIIALWKSTARARGWRLAGALALWCAYYSIHLWGRWMSDTFWIPLLFISAGLVMGFLYAAPRVSDPSPP